MPYREKILAEAEIHHVFTRSIAGYKVFNTEDEFLRLKNLLVFYKVENPPCRFSWFDELKESQKNKFNKQSSLVDIIAYCLMPTHIHLILMGLKDNGISKFMNLILKSYSKYFNLKHKRKGPLWEGRFKNVKVDTDEQLLHLSRYVHLNPVTARLVENPEDWGFSSFNEYLGIEQSNDPVCTQSKYIDYNPDKYKVFVNERIDEQRELAKIKHLFLE